MSKRLQDKVAIVTGAGSVGPGWGNGRATAVRFAEEGAKVFAVDRDPEKLEETVARVNAIGGSIRTCGCDVTDSNSVFAMVQACMEAWGRVDVLVNNVGGSARGGPVEMSEEVWDAQVDFNLKSVFLTCKFCLPIMEGQASGAIVNVASTSGLRWTGAAQVAYAATKAGVIQLSRVVAVQYAAKGIRVNTVVPANCIPRWWKRALPANARAAMWRPCCGSGRPASRWASWATAGHRERRPVPGLRRGPLHHRHGDHCRRWNDGPLRLIRPVPGANRQ